MLDKQLSKPVETPDREVLRAALELRASNWRGVLRGKHIQQARLVLQHLLDLLIKVINEPVPKYIRKGDTRGTENIGKWRVQARGSGLLTGLVQSLASPTGTSVLWPIETQPDLNGIMRRSPTV